jgi:hypothetical protein
LRQSHRKIMAEMKLYISAFADDDLSGLTQLTAACEEDQEQGCTSWNPICTTWSDQLLLVNVCV